jgi:hypothetical protein
MILCWTCCRYVGFVAEFIIGFSLFSVKLDLCHRIVHACSDMAQQLAAQTAFGAAKLVLESPTKHTAALRDSVTRYRVIVITSGIIISATRHHVPPPDVLTLLTSGVVRAFPCHLSSFCPTVQSRRHHGGRSAAARARIGARRLYSSSARRRESIGRTRRCKSASTVCETLECSVAVLLCNYTAHFSLASQCSLGVEIPSLYAASRPRTSSARQNGHDRPRSPKEGRVRLFALGH